MKRKTKILFQNSISREFRRSLSELDRHPLERRIHGEIPDFSAPKRAPLDTRMLVSRAEGLWRTPLKRPRRVGKTAKDHARDRAHNAS